MDNLSVQHFAFHSSRHPSRHHKVRGPSSIWLVFKAVFHKEKKGEGERMEMKDGIRDMQRVVPGSDTFIYCAFSTHKKVTGQDLLTQKTLLCYTCCTDPCFLSGCMCRPIGLLFITLYLTLCLLNRPNVTDVSVQAQSTEAKHRGWLYSASRRREQVERAQLGHRTCSGFSLKSSAPTVSGPRWFLDTNEIFVCVCYHGPCSHTTAQFQWQCVSWSLFYCCLSM